MFTSPSGMGESLEAWRLCTSLFLISVFFVWRSFHKMLIGSET